MDIIGQIFNAVVLVVVHAFRDKDGIEIVRIISARKATKNEQQIYNERCPL